MWKRKRRDIVLYFCFLYYISMYISMYIYFDVYIAALNLTLLVVKTGRIFTI